MQIVDANIVLRYILGDHAELSPKARSIIDEQIVVVPLEVLCEVVHVLSRVYEVNRKDIGSELRVFMENTRCELPHRGVVLKGLELFAENNLDFVDCLLAGYGSVEEAVILTFDRKLQKLLELS